MSGPRQSTRPEAGHVRSLASGTQPYSTGDEFPDFMGAEPRIRSGSKAPVHGSGSMHRLLDIKRIHDHETMFQPNHNMLA
ncbi:hypothetical protein GCM10023166_33000 [Paeniglutamicibacter cryotolerans]